MSTSAREAACAAPSLPPAMAAALAAYAWARDDVGQSGAALYRLHGKDQAPDLFLKHGSDVLAELVNEEMKKLQWLAPYIPVPAVVQFVRQPDQAWLLMSAIDGKTARQVLASRPDLGPALVDAMAAFLRRLHAIPASACPFDSGHLARLRLARQRIDAGAIDVDDFDGERAGWTAEQVWTALQDALPLAADAVLTHGDFSLENLIIHEGDIAGCIDVGRAGVADRYQDLAIAWNSLGEYGAPLQERLFKQYGLARPDQGKLRFHLLLDELF